jgi:3-carboxy-cis,cis-muconate cycloisomerase
VRLAAQLGGAAGTLASLGPSALEVTRLFAYELELPEPELPWHTDRTRVAQLGGSLAVAAGVCAKIGLDVALLEQTEVGEVREPPGAGGSSTMPHKRNPVGSAVAIACARHATAASAVLAAALVGEHERALGAWQSEWAALSDALAAAGGAAAAVRETLEGLDVDVARMRANLDLTGGAIMSEAGRFAPEAHAPEDYLGAAGALVDRVVVAFRGEEA